jgi:hypothetical protein
MIADDIVRALVCSLNCSWSLMVLASANLLFATVCGFKGDSLKGIAI